MPVAKGLTYVVDQRLLSPTNTTVLDYQFQDGVQWVSIEKAKTLETPQPVQQKHSKQAMAIFYGLLLLPSVAFLFFSLRSRRNKSK
jgi:hypothetical protein